MIISIQTRAKICHMNTPSVHIEVRTGIRYRDSPRLVDSPTVKTKTIPENH